ncbi:peptidase M61 domain-containing protein, partial [mine drainage metagenome]
MYMEGYKDQALEIAFNIPHDWRISTALEKTVDNMYRAINYDVLVDSPVEIGKHLSGIFTVDGKEHEVALYGQYDGDFQKLLDDMQKIVEATVRIFEHAPYKRYVFILQAYQGYQLGGLEHSASCAISVDSSMLFDPDYYTNFMSVVAHEYFHTWNVKRIRPLELGPFNYREENYTTLLWFSEGVTDYFADIIVLRAKLMDEAKYMERLGESIKMLEFMPGSLETSLADSSFDAWIRFYKPSSDDVNSYISYYLKGKIIGFLISKKIAIMTAGAKSIDQLLLLLFEKFRKDGKGFSEKDLLSALKDVSGGDFGEFLSRFIRGTEKINFDSELSDLGLSIERKHSAETRQSLSWSGAIVKRDSSYTVS